MDKDEIKNIVFYNFESERGQLTQTCVFYADGSIKNITFEDGKELVNAIKSQIENSDDLPAIHNISGEEFERRFQEFRTAKISVDSKNNQTSTVEETEFSHSIDKDGTPIINLTGNKFTQGSQSQNNSEKKKSSTSIEENNDEVDEFDQEEPLHPYLDVIKEKLANRAKRSKAKKARKKITAKKSKKAKKKARSFRNKFKSFRKKVAALVIAVAVGFGLIGCSNNTKKTDDKKKGGVTLVSETKGINNTTTDDLTEQDIVTMAQGKNFSKLLNMTKNETQKQEMSKIGRYLTFFNGSFANKNSEKGKNIRPALKWNEVNALNLAYNNFSKDEITAIYNGHELIPSKLDGYFKSANLELMGAFVLQTRENPVSLDQLVNSQKGKEYYYKINNLFLDAQEKTGTAKIEAVNKFYKQIMKDFEIDPEEREIGIAHSDSRSNIKGYKLVVMPMVAAAEMMFQNLDIDHTMTNKVIKYFNDNGLCNIANENFERAADFTRNTKEEDKDNPLYRQFKNAKIIQLKKDGWYNVKDKYRDLSQLDAFQKRVNWHFEINDKGNFTGKIEKSSATKTTTSTKTVSKTTTSTKITKEKTSSKKEAVKKAGKKKVAKAEEKVDKEIKKQNKKAKTAAQKQAKKNKKAMQEKANKEAEQKRKEIEAENKKTENDANNIKAGDKISDINNNIHIDDEYVETVNKGTEEKPDYEQVVSDKIENGSITTDGNGAYEDFPDPNVSGAEFDKEADATTNEEKAAKIVEEMANNPTTSTVEEKSYQYTYTR